MNLADFYLCPPPEEVSRSDGGGMGYSDKAHKNLNLPKVLKPSEG